MDPTAALRRLLDAFEDDDGPEAIDCMLDLIDWLQRGGVCPQVASMDGRIFTLWPEEE